MRSRPSSDTLLNNKARVCQSDADLSVCALQQHCITRHYIGASATKHPMVGSCSEKKVLRRPFSFLSFGNIHWQTIKLFLSAFFSTCCSVAFRLGRSWTFLLLLRYSKQISVFVKRIKSSEDHRKFPPPLFSLGEARAP